jgi:membrane-bound serine protease (ClpP class)
MTVLRLVSLLLICAGISGFGSFVVAQVAENVSEDVPGGDEVGTVPPEAGFIVLCHIDGMVDDGLVILVERAVLEARDAQALVFLVDTPGGLVDAAIEITSHINRARCETIAVVDGMGAISAGAMISYACDKIIMTGASNIGAATPVIFSQEGATVAGEKSVSFVRAKFRTLAEINGHNSAIAEAMVDPDIVLRARPTETDTLDIYAATARDAEAEDTEESWEVLSKDKLLTLSAGQAREWGVIEKVALDLEDALSFYGLEAYERRYLEPTWSEQLFRFLTNPTIAGVLILIGIGGLYLEAQSPGFGFPGIIGLTCLALFFGAHMLIGLAQWTDVLLVVIGVVLILIELLVLPGFGIAGIAGIACFGLGLYMSLTRVPIPQYSWEFERLDDVAISFVVAVVGLFAVALLAGWIFPRTPFYGKLVLLTDQQAEQGYVVKTRDTIPVGMRGVAVSTLRPSGRARFNDQTLQVVARGDFIEAGTPVVIIQKDGNRYMVDAVEEKP